MEISNELIKAFMRGTGLGTSPEILSMGIGGNTFFKLKVYDWIRGFFLTAATLAC